MRSELFTLQQMEQHARSLASKHMLTKSKSSEKMLKRLSDNESILMDVHNLLTETVKQNGRINPAGEWLLDNFYLIEDQIYTGKKHLPKGYSKELPQLANGASEGLPRVYDIVVELISHSDGRVDMESLSGFIRAYQSVTILKIGELWAIPIMLRLALIENLRRLSTQIALDILHKNLADYWADQMMETAEKDPKNLVVVLADMARSNPPVKGSFVAELTRRLQGRGSALALPLSWIEQLLSDSGLTGNEVVQIENQKQAALQVSVSNSIGSLRFLNATDWRNFVEQESVTEKILQKDIDGIYGEMDFYTRDNYRHVVEKLSKYSNSSEPEVATIAIKLSAQNPNEDRKKHVGYFLVDKGLKELERVVQVKLPFKDSLRKSITEKPLFWYLAAIAVCTFLLCWFILSADYIYPLKNWQLYLLSFFGCIAASQSAIVLVNWISNLVITPHPLPKMDFSKGIPANYKTLVVVPTMLSAVEDIDNLIEALEVRFIANRDANLYFALLTDFKDACEEHLPEDERLLTHVQRSIQDLNQRYPGAEANMFMLFHRPRKWNAREKVWMGHERKRGKLEELNALLRSNKHDSFSVIIGDEKIFPEIKYVITLDTDTQLPRESAWKMTATLAHPLNKAVYSPARQRVTNGYTILQPRVSNSLPGERSSLYARIHGNEPGVDPYTLTTSDVYQDLFKEGSFIGKGIYDVDMFIHTLEGRFPENRILSHDLIEGAYSRSGFLSDVQLYEEYPSTYFADIKRRHRWVRGDWQIARWLFPFVPSPQKQFRRNPISALSKWKIFDNLRRSLVALSFLVILICCWIYMPGTAITLTVIAALLLPSVVKFIWDLVAKPKDIGYYAHVVYILKNSGNGFFQQFLHLVFLPYEAWINTDAILRTAWRIFISQRKLLEWNPYGNTVRTSPKTIAQYFKAMWLAPAFAAAVLAWLIYSNQQQIVPAVLLVTGWLISPAIAYLVSEPRKAKKAVLSSGQTNYLHKLSRKTWAFFERFVTADDNWLPPDNYQENPDPKIAHRTSPTNIGLSLLANLTAYDFGYISATRLIDRTTRTLDTVQSLEKYRGHLYNWYDTETLACLQPKYISTVDSGNFISHLLVLRQGLLSLKENSIFVSKSFNGLLDTVEVMLEKNPSDENLTRIKAAIVKLKNDPPVTLRQAIAATEQLKVLSATTISQNKIENTRVDWVSLYEIQLEDIIADIRVLCPWIFLYPASGKFNELIEAIDFIPTLQQLVNIQVNTLPKIKEYYKPGNSIAENQWLDMFVSSILESSRMAKERVYVIESLVAICYENTIVDYEFLYSKTQRLLSIGYNAEEHRRDNSYYDLLASESRLGVFVAIAQSKIPQESWFALGRQLSNTGPLPVLLSWSGSMFEYLMPLLVMPSYDNTLLDQTHKGIVLKQIEYGEKRNVPWGVSESGYNMIDAAMNYQYRAFGVPGTGLKRGLGDDLVISPYSTIMALMVMPEEATENLKRMSSYGFEDEFGFHEAIDYTTSRLPRGQEYALINSYMVHHQGMAFLSLSYLLLNQPMQKRFVNDVQLQSALLLLQERIPRVTVSNAPAMHIAESGIVSKEQAYPIRVINTPHTPVPEVQLLSNGRYHVVVTNAGGGYSRWKDIAVTRWREDSTCDNWGSFCFIKDVDSNAYWSTAYQPLMQEGEHYEAVFSQGRAEFRRRDASIETHTEIVVSPEDDVELRRIKLTNRSRRKRKIEITSYSEVVLTTAAADAAHPAFSNLFVETELLEQQHAIICTRRPRTQTEVHPAMFHLMKAYKATIKNVSYETDRMKFIGRGNTIHQPDAMLHNGAMSSTQGAVLDPVISIRYEIEIDPQKTVIIDIVTGIAETKESCMELVGKYQDKFLVDRGFELSWTHSQVILRQINASEKDAQLYGRLASAVIYLNQALRASPDIIERNNRGQSGLWGYSISGDLPIVLVQIEEAKNIELVKQMIQAHAYWRMKGLAVDLVIWNEDYGSYRHTLQNEIQALVSPLVGAQIKEVAGGVFIRSSDQISYEDRILFQTVARVMISDRFGTLEEQVSRVIKTKNVIPYFTPQKFYPSITTAVSMPKDLQFFNDTGGFSGDGKEYIIFTNPEKLTPVPWSNVVANEQFGTVISESGQAYSWLENAHEYRLTPWNNNPVGDLEGECYYLRDEESGKFWSPAPLPTRSKTAYITRHGFGYSIFEHSEDGIYSTMTVFVDQESGVKFTLLALHNQSGRQRKLSATGYVEWVLGEFKHKTQMHVVTSVDTNSGTIYARNAYNLDFENRVAFFDGDHTLQSFTCDRKEFIGRNGTNRNPEALNKVKLSGKYGAALDPCAAIQSTFDLGIDEKHEIVFKLGAAKNQTEANVIIEKFKTIGTIHQSFETVKQYWDETLGTVQIQTPDAALNIITNGWLNYQALACRIWGRSGYYQSGGAFGFRDQLQDVLSLLYTKPEIARQQILLNASRQFTEGDVQHWWHPPMGRGVRTTCSDDFLWLPFATIKYINYTGDESILDEQITFLEGRLLNHGEESYYDLPARSSYTAGLYTHCVKAIENGLKFGEHGLPLIGSGDWNDGMDKIGEEGKGESVWLAFFQYKILSGFSEIAEARNDFAFKTHCLREAENLKQNIEAHAWDGNWYRRAYFDDGTPLGSVQNEECSIDSIAQSWGVISNAADGEKIITAMNAAYRQLVNKEAGIIKLLDPPFDKSTLDPGYIKGYVPGVRENGGQYTHAAIWFVMALMELKQNEKGWELLQMINPLNRGGDKTSVERYKVEPYVVAADVYAQVAHLGRGGWTWYTGSAGWMYQLIIEYFLGMQKQGNELYFNPSVPEGWNDFSITYKYVDTIYVIKIKTTDTPDATLRILYNGLPVADKSIKLINDKGKHMIEVTVNTKTKTILPAMAERISKPIY
ncbi:MAG: cyclic beta 1-2 glucan synthetase [Chitinophagaceae bacterium]|nr:cyclic beta 1-2 glucan synthetase [Chitinophagaceae bacterium]